MTNSEHFPADPWGLPIEESDEAVSETVPPVEEEAPVPVEASADTSTRPETEPEAGAEEQPEAKAEEYPEGEQEEQPEAEAATAEPQGEPTDLQPETLEPEPVETTSSGEPTPDSPTAREPEAVSQPHAAARGVLDALGISGNDEDLPEEPPAWMVDEPEAEPPSAYASLSDLATPEEAAADETGAGELDTAIEGAIDAIEEPLAEPLPDIEDLEPGEADIEIEGAIDAIEEPLAEPLPDTEDLEPGDDEAAPRPEEPVVVADTEDGSAQLVADEASPESPLEAPDLEDIYEVIEAFTPDGESESEGLADASEDLAEPVLEEIRGVTVEPTDEVEEAAAGAVAASETIEDVAASDTQPPANAAAAPVESPDVAWGTSWKDAAQGWVQQADGTSTWRPIVTTTLDAGLWDIDTFLGVVAGDAVVPVLDAGHELPAARARALRAMLDDALVRGAHAVVGVRIDVQEVGTAALVSAVGTAVTLRNA